MHRGAVAMISMAVDRMIERSGIPSLYDMAGMDMLVRMHREGPQH